jgi:hypothetical protein
MEDLARESGVGRTTLQRFEGGSTIYRTTRKCILDAFADQGITFPDDGTVCRAPRRYVPVYSD